MIYFLFFSDSEESSEDETPAKKPAPTQPVKKPTLPAKKTESSSEEDSSEDEAPG